MTTFTDLDAWRRVCLSAYDNLCTDTEVTMAEVDAVLTAGAREYAPIDSATDEGQAQLTDLLDRVAASTGVERDEADAILCQSAKDAAPLLRDDGDYLCPCPEHTGDHCTAQPKA
jgi:hypothetical protein